MTHNKTWSSHVCWWTWLQTRTLCSDQVLEQLLTHSLWFYHDCSGLYFCTLVWKPDWPETKKDDSECLVLDSVGTWKIQPDYSALGLKKQNNHKTPDKRHNSVSGTSQVWTVSFQTFTEKDVEQLEFNPVLETIFKPGMIFLPVFIEDWNAVRLVICA